MSALKLPRKLDRVLLSFFFSLRLGVSCLLDTPEELARNEQLKQRGNGESYGRKLNANGEKRVTQKDHGKGKGVEILGGEKNDLFRIISFVVL